MSNVFYVIVCISIPHISTHILVHTLLHTYLLHTHHHTYIFLEKGHKAESDQMINVITDLQEKIENGAAAAAGKCVYAGLLCTMLLCCECVITFLKLYMYVYISVCMYMCLVRYICI